MISLLIGVLWAATCAVLLVRGVHSGLALIAGLNLVFAMLGAYESWKYPDK